MSISARGFSQASGAFKKGAAFCGGGFGLSLMGGLVWSGYNATMEGIQMRGLHDAEKYAVLAAAYASENVQEGTHVRNEGVGGYRTKTVYAGDRLYISVYPLIGGNASREQRRRLEELSAEREKCARLRAKYQRYNNRRRIREFEQLVHENFRQGDLHVCCTYSLQDYREYSALVFRTREDAKREIRNYIRRVRHMLKRHGAKLDEFRWICVTVSKAGIQEAGRPFPDRHHHHLLMHGVPEALRGAVESLWELGYCNADRLRRLSDGFAAIAGYIARQESSSTYAGERSFTTSRNIKRPRVTTCDSKISRRRVAMIAADVRMYGREIFGKLFPGYRLADEIRVEASQFVAGAYIYACLERLPAGSPLRWRSFRRRQEAPDDALNASGRSGAG